MSYKILVSGGAGYIGSLLTPALLQKGYEVTVLDNLMYNQGSLFDLCSNNNFKFINNEINNINLIKEIINDFDIYIPLAALVGAPLCARDPSKTKLINYDSHIDLFNYIRDDLKIIFPSTNSGYGKTKQGEFCNEDSKVNPLSNYGKYKLDIEKKYLNRKNSIVFRFATIFGCSPRMRMDLLVNDFVYKAYKDNSIVLFESNFRRNFLHILDAVNAFCFAIDNFEKMKSQIYNVGLSSANLTKLQLAQKIKVYFPDLYIHTSEINSDPDKRDYLVSNEKIEKLGWKAKHNLESGIIELKKLYSMIKANQYSNF